MEVLEHIAFRKQGKDDFLKGGESDAVTALEYKTRGRHEVWRG